MTLFIGAMFIIVGILLAYALALRPWLKKQSWAQGFFAKIDTIEAALYKKSETVLAGRLLWLGGGVVTAYDAVGTWFNNLDFTPITTRIFDFIHIPQDLRGLTLSAFITAIGLMIVNLRKKVTKPLEVVALPNSQVTPAAAQAIARVDVANGQAVAAVEQAKA
jgi:hypothetical protein